MVIVKVYVAPSPIHGLGVFAAEDIPAGTVTWREHDAVDRPLYQADLLRIPEPARSEIVRHCYKLKGEPFLRLALDAARYMNHAAESNCRYQEDGRQDVAVRLIHAGEEITTNYYLFDDRLPEGFFEKGRPCA